MKDRALRRAGSADAASATALAAAYLNRMAVLPSHQGSGIGRACRFYERRIVP